MATIASALVAIGALPIVVYQVIQFNRSEAAASRSYVSVHAEVGQNRGRAVVFLILQNHGRSMATDISLHFDSPDNWHYVARPEKFPFLYPNIIWQLLPGEQRKYFIGTLEERSRLLALRAGKVSGVVSYSDAASSNRREEFFLTLADLTYVAK